MKCILKIYELRKAGTVIENSVPLQNRPTKREQNAVELMGKESVLPRPKSAKQLGYTHSDPNASELDSQTTIPTRAQTLPIELPNERPPPASSAVVELFVPPENAEKPTSAPVATNLYVLTNLL